jgi:predicted dehydrogenase
MNGRTYGVAVIGAGDRGTAYARAWSRVHQVRLVSVCDLIPERRDRLQALFGFQGSTADYREAIRRDEVDIVTVCVPAALHVEIGRFALELGKHVLMEKPMALSLAEATVVTEMAAHRGLKLGLGFQYRYISTFRKVKKALDAGWLGSPTFVQFADIRQIRAHKPAMHDLKAGNGGPIVDMCCHFTDLMRWYFGADPVRVMAVNRIFAQCRPELMSISMKAPDTSAIIIEYIGGHVGQILLCWGLPPGIAGMLDHRIVGPKGILTVGQDGTVSALLEGGERVTIALDGKEEEKGLDNTDVEQPTYSVVLDFLAAIEEDRPPSTGGIDGQIALATSLAALKSGRSGRTVTIEEIMGEQPTAADFA